MIERYTRPEMGKIWTPENRYQAWLRVELAVCEAWNRVGEISDADMETLRKEADFTVDAPLSTAPTKLRKPPVNDVIAFLTAIEEKVGPVSRFIHLGCTSSDIVDTAGSLCEGAKALKKFGAKDIYACVTHPILTDPALSRIAQSEIKELIVTNTIPLPPNKKHPKITQLSVAPILAETILRIYNQLSISQLFQI